MVLLVVNFYMNIILLTSSLGNGGAERVASTLCNEWVKQDNKVTLIATFSGGGVAFYPLSLLVNVIFLADLIPTRRKSLFSYWQRLFGLRKIILSNSADVVVSFLPNVNIAAIFATAFTKVPVVISERRDPASHPTSRLLEWACSTFYRFADAVVVQTDNVRRSTGTLYPSLKHVVCVPNPMPQEIKQFLHGDMAKPRRVLLSLGRLISGKQVDHTLKAFAELAGSNEDWDLHVYGDGPEKEALMSLVAELGLVGRAFLMGRTTQPWDVMAKADAFVMTSRSEGFPNSLFEAMAVGLPCVVYDCPSGPHDITRGGQDALLVPLNDQVALTQALQQVMGDSALRKDLGERARASVLARYELKVVLRQWDEVFRQVGVRV